jgi:hypothetical protein
MLALSLRQVGLKVCLHRNRMISLKRLACFWQAPKLCSKNSRSLALKLIRSAEMVGLRALSSSAISH